MFQRHEPRVGHADIRSRAARETGKGSRPVPQGVCKRNTHEELLYVFQELEIRTVICPYNSQLGTDPAELRPHPSWYIVYVPWWLLLCRPPPRRAHPARIERRHYGTSYHSGSVPGEICPAKSTSNLPPCATPNYLI